MTTNNYQEMLKNLNILKIKNENLEKEKMGYQGKFMYLNEENIKLSARNFELKKEIKVLHTTLKLEQDTREKIKRNIKNRIKSTENYRDKCKADFDKYDECDRFRIAGELRASKEILQDIEQIKEAK